MQVSTDAIAFPENTVGQDAITQILVKDFNQTYENIYTVCLKDTLNIDNHHLECRWLVYMNEIVSGINRIGFGSYQWKFEKGHLKRVNHLKIMIDDMIILPADKNLFSWIESLPYPWANSSDILASLPDIDSLKHLHNKLVS